MPTTDAGQPAEPVAAPLEETSVLHEQRVADGFLRWQGSPPPEGTPRTFGVEQLVFEHAAGQLPFRPTGTLQFSDWSFDVVSPDGTWVVLLQDRHGPYHAVQTDHLAAYLRGEREPDRVIAYEGAGAFRPVLQAQRWTDAHTFTYVEAGETKSERSVALD